MEISVGEGFFNFSTKGDIGGNEMRETLAAADVAPPLRAIRASIAEAARHSATAARNVRRCIGIVPMVATGLSARRHRTKLARYWRPFRVAKLVCRRTRSRIYRDITAG